MNIKKDFGARIKELRNKKGITQYQLAEMAGVDPKHLSHIETGRSFPKADLIEKFACALEVDYLEFFRIEHFLGREFMIEKINSILKNSSNEDLTRIFKIINSCIN